MPTIYLSPSTQEGNQYVTGGSEEYYMNLLADAMIPYLRASGIQWSRNTPEMTARSSIQASNAGRYDLHVALHSNGAPEGRYGEERGSEVYYYPSSTLGRRAAQIIANNLKSIYPNPSEVSIRPTTRLGEVRQTRAPSVLIEFAYHDNPDDANWIINNLQEIAQNVVLSLTEYFGIPYINPQPVQNGTVQTDGAPLNIRQRPDRTAPVLARAPHGAPLTIYGNWKGWDVVRYNGITGYADSQYIQT